MGAVHQCAAESEIVSQDFHKCWDIGHLLMYNKDFPRKMSKSFWSCVPDFQ